MHAIASTVFSALLFFVVVGVNRTAGLLLLAALPPAAVFLSTLGLRNGIFPRQPSREDAVRAEPPSWGFLLRLFVGVAVFSAATNVTHGMSVLASDVAVSEVDELLLTIILGTIGFFLVGRYAPQFDIVKCYYPVVVLAGLGVAAPLLLGSIMPGLADSPTWITVSTLASNTLMLFIWCLCAHLSYASHVSAVRVFGIGRCASAIGSTAGEALGGIMFLQADEDPSFAAAMLVLMLFALFATVLLVFNEHTIRAAFKWDEPGGIANSGVPVSEGAPPTFCPESSGADAATDRPGQWTTAVEELAAHCDLSAREREVLLLLGKGRTISYIAEELGISFNTAKTHVRKVYQKAGVHTRQELFDEIEERKRSGHSTS